MILNSGQQQIGDFAPFSGGSIALGRTYASAASKYAGDKASRLTGGAAALAQHAAAAVVAPTKQVLSVKSANPTTGVGDAPAEGGIPKPVLIGAGVLGVLAIGLVAYKATR